MNWKIVGISFLLASGVAVSLSTWIGWHNARMKNEHNTPVSYLMLTVLLFFQFVVYGHAIKEIYDLFRN